MARKIVLGTVAIVVVVIVGFVLLVSMQPDDFSVSRSATMPAPPEEVFPHVNNFHNWEAWSPWAKLDPNAKESFDGPESGEGAEFSWDGNDDVGAGNMTITKSVPDELIQIKLNFVRPFEDTCDVEFEFAPVESDQTEVTWTMSGEHTFISKAMCLFMGGMDSMVGPDFEKGLASMKKAVESPAEEQAGGVPDASADDTGGSG